MPYLIDGHNLIPKVSGLSLDEAEDDCGHAGGRGECAGDVMVARPRNKLWNSPPAIAVTPAP